jgi:hypothetical protein
MKKDLRYISLMLFVLLLFPAMALSAEYTVSGAPTPAANGVYVQNGTSDGVPSYSKGDWVLQRSTIMGPVWIIRNGPATFDDIIYWNWPDWPDPSPDLPPNNRNWEIRETGTVIPELTIIGPDRSIGGRNLLLLE